jgi:hypothetical protein
MEKIEEAKVSRDFRESDFMNKFIEVINQSFEL